MASCSPDADFILKSASFDLVDEGVSQRFCAASATA
jgi:hypothetical protein